MINTNLNRSIWYNVTMGNRLFTLLWSTSTTTKKQQKISTRKCCTINKMLTFDHIQQWYTLSLSHIVELDCEKINVNLWNSIYCICCVLSLNRHCVAMFITTSMIMMTTATKRERGDITWLHTISPFSTPTTFKWMTFWWIQYNI